MKLRVSVSHSVTGVVRGLKRVGTIECRDSRFSIECMTPWEAMRDLPTEARFSEIERSVSRTRIDFDSPFMCHDVIVKFVEWQRSAKKSGAQPFTRTFPYLREFGRIAKFTWDGTKATLDQCTLDPEDADICLALLEACPQLEKEFQQVFVSEAEKQTGIH
ncbi:MAG: hypothetical protein WCK89_23300 [bacterium]